MSIVGITAETLNTLSDGHRRPLFPRGPGLGLKALALLAVCGALIPVATRHFAAQTTVITPIGLDPTHPFPRLVNKSLNFIVSLEGKDAFGRDSEHAIVQGPRSLPRVVPVPGEGSGKTLVLLTAIVVVEAAPSSIVTVATVSATSHVATASASADDAKPNASTSAMAQAKVGNRLLTR